MARRRQLGTKVSRSRAGRHEVFLHLAAAGDVGRSASRVVTDGVSPVRAGRWLVVSIPPPLTVGIGAPQRPAVCPREHVDEPVIGLSSVGTSVKLCRSSW